ncbi:MAG: hypothetical protein AB2693_22680, partial [Candidatus Thiodiazotropha sp.]
FTKRNNFPDFLFTSLGLNSILFTKFDTKYRENQPEFDRKPKAYEDHLPPLITTPLTTSDENSKICKQRRS